MFIKEAALAQSEQPLNGVYSRAFMRVYQVRSDDGKSSKGNKAIIDDIFKDKPLPLFFANDELKNAILYSDANPTRKVFQVDVELKNTDGKYFYNVLVLHDINDFE